MDKLDRNILCFEKLKPQYIDKKREYNLNFIIKQIIWIKQ